MRKTSDYLGQSALVCTRRLCPFCVQEWLLRSKLGRALLAVLAVLALVGVAALLGGCGPKKAEQPKPEVSCSEDAGSGLKVCWHVKVVE